MTCMNRLSIFMPSNRDFASSRRALETALEFCIKRDALLVVADNSGDAAKKARWSKPNPNVLYLDTGGLDAKQNFVAALRATKSEFVLPMGDDDEITFDPSHTPFDLTSLTGDFMGILPRTEVWSTTRGILKTKAFAIEGTDPKERMLEYNANANGDNGAFYSIFRREPYQKLMDLFFAKHPVAGGFSDWAMVMALLSWGKMVHDPSFTFRYNYDQWQTQDLVEQRNQLLYRQSGLPDGAKNFHYLFLALDLFCFSAADFSPMGKDDTATALDTVAGPFLNAFLKKVATSPEQFEADIHQLCFKLDRQSYMFDRFLTALDMAETVQTGLKAKYIAFFNAAMGDG